MFRFLLFNKWGAPEKISEIMRKGAQTVRDTFKTSKNSPISAPKVIKEAIIYVTAKIKAKNKLGIKIFLVSLYAKNPYIAAHIGHMYNM